jgi:hypothetical protein
MLQVSTPRASEPTECVGASFGHATQDYSVSAGTTIERRGGRRRVTLRLRAPCPGPRCEVMKKATSIWSRARAMLKLHKPSVGQL